MAIKTLSDSDMYGYFTGSQPVCPQLELRLLLCHPQTWDTRALTGPQKHSGSLLKPCQSWVGKWCSLLPGWWWWWPWRWAVGTGGSGGSTSVGPSHTAGSHRPRSAQSACTRPGPSRPIGSLVAACGGRWRWPVGNCWSACCSSAEGEMERETQDLKHFQTNRCHRLSWLWMSILNDKTKLCESRTLDSGVFPSSKAQF